MLCSSPVMCMVLCTGWTGEVIISSACDPQSFKHTQFFLKSLRSERHALQSIGDWSLDLVWWGSLSSLFIYFCAHLDAGRPQFHAGYWLEALVSLSHRLPQRLLTQLPSFQRCGGWRDEGQEGRWEGGRMRGRQWGEREEGGGRKGEGGRKREKKRECDQCRSSNPLQLINS